MTVTQPFQERTLPTVSLRTTLPALLLAACGATSNAPDASHGSSAPQAQQPQRGPVYSPFVVGVQGTEAFSVISFKDVGMSLAPEDRAYLYESLAEGLAAQLRDGAPALATIVDHDEGITDPQAHLACEAGHVYVDLWKAGSGWGYSLWSGCGEDDEFAHREIPAPEASMEPLARDIATQLQVALQTSCFVRHC